MCASYDIVQILYVVLFHDLRELPDQIAAGEGVYEIGRADLYGSRASQHQLEDILGGAEVDGGILWCVPELVSKAPLDRAAEIVKEVCAK